jgi:prepilin-type N-terminal cleavage/methylation domain-containing protein
MSRRAFSLIEMMASVVLMALVLDIGITTTVALGRSARDDGTAGFSVDLACDALRRDLAAGARLDGADLLAGGARWSLRHGQLLRGGIPRARVVSAVWRIDAGRIVVTLKPIGLPPREISAWP